LFRLRFVPIAQGAAQMGDLELEIRDLRLAHHILAIAQQFLRMPNQELAVFNVFFREHPRKVAAPPALQNRFMWRSPISRDAALRRPRVGLNWGGPLLHTPQRGVPTHYWVLST